MNNAAPETVTLTPEQERARKRRNMLLAWSVGAFVLLVFLISMAQMTRYAAMGAGQ